MINAELANIEISDLKALIDNQVPESKTIEYKMQLPGELDADKKEFLADVSSFSNTNGGDLIFGIKEEKGIPIEIIGIEIDDLDLVLRKYDQIIQSGLEPRITYETARIPLDASHYVIVYRIKRSWVGPHRIVFRGWDKFYERNSTGKYPLDTTQLRAAFNLSETIIEKIQRFRMERVNAVISNETSIPLNDRPKAIFHIIPQESFYPNAQIDMKLADQLKDQLYPIRSEGHYSRYNLEGIITYSGNAIENYTYVQLFRKGIIEVVFEPPISGEDKTKSYLYIYEFEKMLIHNIMRMFDVMKGLSIGLPYYIFMALTAIKGYRLWRSNSFSGRDDKFVNNNENIILPDFIMDADTEYPDRLLQPMFDLLWNSFGYEKAFNYDGNGNWK